jgi:hypothetical protein
MIAVIASLVILFYVLVPSAIFRLVASLILPIKKFHKTKVQDFTFSVSICIVPALVAILLVWYVVHWPFPTSTESLADRRLAYRTFLVAMDSDKELEQSLRPPLTASGQPGKPIFWWSVNSVLKRQGRFLFWFYFLVALEGKFVSWLARTYRTDRRRLADRLGDVLLPPIISEWYVMLEAFGSPPAQREINIDVLTSDGILYQGKLKDYFFDVEGSLSGILLSSALRFAHEEYAEYRRLQMQAGNEGAEPDGKDRFWRPVPGSDVFFIPRDRISNINVRHVTKNVETATKERLADRKIDVADLRIAEDPKRRDHDVDDAEY